MDADGAQTLVFPSHSPLSNINDNYCMTPTSVPTKLVWLDPKFQKTEFSKTVPSVNLLTLKSDVCCTVVSHVPIVHSHGPPQKKGVSPVHCLSRIKHVRGVFSVNPCCSVPIAPNVPNAVAGQNVGGRLQQFWHIWSALCSKGRVYSAFQTKTTLDKVSCGSKWLRPTHQKQVSERSLDQPHRKVGNREGSCQVLPGFLQPTLSGAQTEQKMEANLGPKPVKSVPIKHFLQNGNSGDNPFIPTERGMGHLAGLQRCVFPHSDKPKVKKVSKILPERSDLPIHSPSLWAGHCSPGVYKGGQRSETYGSSKRYQNPPVLRRLVIESPVPGNLPTTYPDPFGPLPTVGLDSKHAEIRARTPAGLQFHRIPIRPSDRVRPTHSGPVDDSQGEITVYQESAELQSDSSYL